MLKATVADRDPQQWGLVLLQGIALFILALLLLSAPEMTTVVLTACLGIYWLISGILSIVRIFSGNRTGHWLWPLLVGILGIVAGLVVLQHPQIIAAVAPLGVVVVIAGVAICKGAIDIVHGVRGGGWAPIVTGILDVIIGLMLLGSPATIAAALPVWLGVLGLFGSFALLTIAYMMRQAAKKAPQPSAGGTTVTT
jgi:uncharacterized membrane protein HdeD (DUF308 family)